MAEPLLICDGTYLCHRAFHAVGNLRHEEQGTGAIFGFLRDIVLLQEEFKTTRCVFAFDYGGPTHRHRLSPHYKRSRRERHAEGPEEEQAARQNLVRQMRALRRRYLPAAGFRNVFEAKGFEGDDIVASVAARVPRNEEAVIIGSDKDLWQCIRRNIFCWNPQRRRATTYEVFVEKWGLGPCRWAEVKALAGDPTDDVYGIKGVGELTAARYLRGVLGPHTKAYQKIREQAASMLVANIPLVRLPYPGTPTFEVVEDAVTEGRWQALADELGMSSIRNTVPRAAPRASKGRKRGEGFGFDRP